MLFRSDDIDRAMRWGFGWLMGPFEMWDAIGVSAVAEAIGLPAPPPLVTARIEKQTRSTAVGPALGKRSHVGTSMGAGVNLPGPDGTELRSAGRLIAMEDVWHATLSCGVGSPAGREFIRLAIEAASQQAEALVISLDGAGSESRGFVGQLLPDVRAHNWEAIDRKSTRLNSSH